MENKTYQIKIESILGGHSPATHFSGSDQFLGSTGIDPGISPGNSSLGRLSGLLVPSSSSNISGENVTGAPMWIKAEPKTQTYYIYDVRGSVYSTDGSTITPLGDLNDGGSAAGNGMAYYDNYIYFSRNTTVARYGPLNGTPTFADDYWVGTLGKTALVDTLYPYETGNTLEYPNHILHRHSDGRLYIADVVGNLGTVHYIETTKTTVEGDTDNGSTYSKLTVGYGLWPTAMESYGSDLVIAFFEGMGGSPGNAGRSNAKIAFWDTTSQNVNKITWVEFPDPLVSAIKNANGVLYVVSGNPSNSGYRVSRFIGGYTFEEVAYFEGGFPSFAGAVDAIGNRLFFGNRGSIDNQNTADGGAWSIGLSKSTLGNGLFNVMRSTSSTSSTQNSAYITSLSVQALTFVAQGLISGWSTGASGGSRNGIDVQDGSTYDQAVSVWWSQLYKIGQPFKIKKIRIPIAYQAIGANMIVTPKIYTDEGAGTTYTLAAINNTNDPGAFNVVRRSGSSGEVITGQHSFFLELRWTGSALCVVGLPIIIEYELIDD